MPEPTTMVQALNAALRDAMASDDRVLVFGEDVSRLGGVFRVTDGLRAAFGARRCFDTPLSESGIVGTAIGLAMRNYRPVAEIQFDGFTYPAVEQIVSHLAKYRYRTRGAVSMPVTLRIPSFGGIGAAEHHSESIESYMVHTAGLKVVVPSTSEDAYSLLLESIRCDDPVVFLEPKVRYWTKAPADLPACTSPIGTAEVRRAGTDVTVVAYGPTVATALEAAEIAALDGVSLEVLDLRSLVPLDEEAIISSVMRTGRCVVVHQAPRTLGFAAEIAAIVQERAFFRLEAPVIRATGYDTPYPPARNEAAWLPDAALILDAVDRVLSA